MTDERAIELLAVEMRQASDAAASEAAQARERLARIAAGLTPVGEANPDEIRAAADTYAGAVERHQALEGFAGKLRRLLMQ